MPRDNRAVPPKVWAPAVRAILAEPLAVTILDRLQAGETRADILHTLQLAEEDYFTHLGTLHDAAVLVVKAYWTYERLRRGEVSDEGLSEEAARVAAAVRDEAATRTFMGFVERFGSDPRSAIDGLNRVGEEARRSKAR